MEHQQRIKRQRTTRGPVGGDREAKATTAEEAPMEPSELDLHVSQANTPTPAPFVRTTSSTQPLPDGLPRPGQCKRPRKAITEEESKATTAEEAPTSEGAAVGAEFEAEGATNTHTEDLRGKLDKLLWKIKKLFEPLNKELSLKESPASKDPWCGSVINTANPVFDEAAKMLEQHKPEGERDNDLYWTLDPDLTNDQLVHKRVEFRQMYDQLAKEVTTFDLSYEKIPKRLRPQALTLRVVDFQEDSKTPAHIKKYMHRDALHAQAKKIHAQAAKKSQLLQEQSTQEQSTQATLDDPSSEPSSAPSWRATLEDTKSLEEEAQAQEVCERRGVQATTVLAAVTTVISDDDDDDVNHRHTTRHDESTTDRVAIILEPSSAPSVQPSSEPRSTPSAQPSSGPSNAPSNWPMDHIQGHFVANGTDWVRDPPSEPSSESSKAQLPSKPSSKEKEDQPENIFSL